MTYLIIESFYPENVKKLYQQVEEKGRRLPDGVTYLSSWINEDVTTCYQIMESESMEKLLEWTELWKEFAAFEIIPVINSAQAKEKVFSDKE